jgi:hypothetical protein
MTKSKVGRRYKLTVEIDITTSKQNAIEIRTPLTLEFDIDRNTSSSLNKGVFRVYNLSETNRSAIFQNLFSIKDATGKRKKVILQAGYNTALNRDSDLSTIFRGDLLESYSYRQGANIITYISAQDGAFSSYTSTSNVTLEAGTSIKDGFKKIASNLGLKIGAVGETEGIHETSSVFNNNTFYLLKKDFKDEFFIDLEKVNKLNPNEVIKAVGKVPLITSGSGLLGTPLRQGSNLGVNMLFEPRINVAQLVEVQSNFNKTFDGQYKVNGVKHSGVISDAVAGDCRTTLQLYAGDKLLGGLQQV